MKSQHNFVKVLAPARLHMGFIDLSSALGRDFGSIGIGLNEIYTQIQISPSHEFCISGLVPERAKKYARLLCNAMHVPDNIHIKILSAIPEHVGLGSGTQLALAIGVGLAKFYGLDLTVRDVAVMADRGARSGIGIGVFEHGGLILDGGRGSNTLTPPLLVQLPVPDDWRFILLFDQRGQGLHGEQEINAFKTLPPFSRQTVEGFAYLLLMQALPAVVENDLQKFGEVITALQIAVGEHFAPLQGGIFTSQEVAQAISFLQNNGAVAIGQTSWGPTGFCAVRGDENAQQLVAQVLDKFTSPYLSLMVVSPRNQKADIIVG